MSLDSLPGGSRLWLLALAQPPDPAGAALLAQGLEEILSHWRHKGQAYQAAGALLEPQLIAVAEPLLATRPSGCAIDGMLRKVRRLLESLGLDLVDPAASLLVRMGGRLVPIPKGDLQARLDDGTLDSRTPVLDLSLYSLQDLRNGGLERALAATWVARRYRLAVVVAADP